MVKLTNQERLRPWMGVVVFFIGLTFLFTIGSIAQTAFYAIGGKISETGNEFVGGLVGQLGLVITEIGFLAISIVFCLIRKVSIKEVFPLKKFSAAQFFGVVIMLIGSLMTSLIAVGISMFVITSLKLNDLVKLDSLQEYVYSNNSAGVISLILTLLIMAVLPAICEESFMRGAVFSCFRGMKKEWVVVIIIGALFGLLHLDPVRFMNTAILGGMFAYIMIKTNNFILPVLFHFMNNAFATIVGFLPQLLSKGTELSDATTSLADLDWTIEAGLFLLSGFAAPIIIVLGAMLIDRKSHRPRRFAIAGIISAVLLAAGIAFTVKGYAGSFSEGTILSWNYSYEVTEDALQADNLAKAGIEISEERSYMVVVSAMASGSEVTFELTDENGNEIISKTSSNMLILSESPTLAPGHYDLTFYGGEDLLGKTFTYEVVVR